MEDGIRYGRLSGTVVLFAVLISGILLSWGLILEGRDGL
jgi:hypothetical protein